MTISTTLLQTMISKRVRQPWMCSPHIVHSQAENEAKNEAAAQAQPPVLALRYFKAYQSYQRFPSKTYIRITKPYLTHSQLEEAPEPPPYFRPAPALRPRTRRPPRWRRATWSAGGCQTRPGGAGMPCRAKYCQEIRGVHSPTNPGSECG